MFSKFLCLEATVVVWSPFDDLRQFADHLYPTYAQHSMFREHTGWIEAMAVVQTTLNDRTVEEIFSAGADGKLLRWQLDTEQNCDVYECIVSFWHLFALDEMVKQLLHQYIMVR